MPWEKRVKKLVYSFLDFNNKTEKQRKKILSSDSEVYEATEATR
jgi:hypothetical protein